MTVTDYGDGLKQTVLMPVSAFFMEKVAEKVAKRGLISWKKSHMNVKLLDMEKVLREEQYEFLYNRIYRR